MLKIKSASSWFYYTRTFIHRSCILCSLAAVNCIASPPNHRKQLCYTTVSFETVHKGTVVRATLLFAECIDNISPLTTGL
jgi:hypothetical protein